MTGPSGEAIELAVTMVRSLAGPYATDLARAFDTFAARRSECPADESTAMAYLVAQHDYARVPDHLRPGIEAWIREAREPGQFLLAVLRNDLHEAIARADHLSLYALPVVVAWLANRAPSRCWGSLENVEAWTGLPAWQDEP